jgi:hypothetical protein
MNLENSSKLKCPSLSKSANLKSSSTSSLFSFSPVSFKIAYFSSFGEINPLLSKSRALKAFLNKLRLIIFFKIHSISHHLFPTPLSG